MTENLEYEIHPEEERLIARAKMMVLIRMGLAGAVGLMIAGILIFIFADPPGKMFIGSNIKGAEVIIDSCPSGYETDVLIDDLTAGEHIFSVELTGFQIVGDFSQKIRIVSGGIDSIYFELEKIEEIEDSYGREGD